MKELPPFFIFFFVGKKVFPTLDVCDSFICSCNYFNPHRKKVMEGENIQVYAKTNFHLGDMFCLLCLSEERKEKEKRTKASTEGTDITLLAVWHIRYDWDVKFRRLLNFFVFFYHLYASQMRQIN